ncbi:MAG: carbamoyltransferase HypF [Candidatus Lokiarchaeota archaeon]|nr:carbamoyltransferase HypF [Candidatus Lokiarchaeota archaeon]
MTKTYHASIKIQGIVQGVGFRPFISVLANSLNLNGTVLNLGNAGVRIEIEGSKKLIEDFVERIKSEKPRISTIDKIDIKWSERLHNYHDFTILKSVDEKGESLVLPPDVATCKVCLKQFNDPKNERYYEYPFIACTECGPRFTSVINLPYDRPRTTMDDFPFCPDCYKEYTTLGNRRFHAQTFACRNCGPKFVLKNKHNRIINEDQPIRTAMELLSHGNIIAIKGIGGIHIACKSTSDKILKKIRNRKKRVSKPFAIMCPNISTLKGFAEISEIEEKQLISFKRPIVLVKKSSEYYLSSLIAPGIDTVGVFLPYSGIHYLLFKYTNEPAIVLTSANRTDEPMIISNELALKKLTNLADYFLLHDRVIYQRCDDSVILVNQKIPTLIRRSRGYVPQWINTPINNEEVVVALGPEERNTGCILKKGRAYFTQHIGNLTNLDQFDFQINAIKHLMKLTRTEDAGIYACDLHPQFLSTRLAHELAKEHSAQVFQVQHHIAHAAGLMAEHNITKPIICISYDGYGYGLDGNAWGGEIFYSDYHNMERIGHLQEQPMPGSDLCTKFPVRMLASILSNIFSTNELWDFLQNGYVNHFKYAEKEIEIMLKQLKNKMSLLKTTSCGRVLDAVSSLLNISHVRNYSGEPAMKLESCARKYRKNNSRIIPQIKNINGKTVLNTSYMILKLIDLLNNGVGKNEIAYNAHAYIANGAADIAIEKCHEFNLKTVGFTGGVAFNTIITGLIKKRVVESGLEFIQHCQVPPGDGGVSFGQAIMAASKEN